MQVWVRHAGGEPRRAGGEPRHAGGEPGYEPEAGGPAGGGLLPVLGDDATLDAALITPVHAAEPSATLALAALALALAAATVAVAAAAFALAAAALA